MHSPLSILRDQRGIAFPMAGFAIIAVLAVGSLGVGTGHVFMINSELQNAADAGALGGVRALFEGNDPTLEAEVVVKDNFVSTETGTTPLGDDNIVSIVTGNYAAATGFQAGIAPENAVEVVTTHTVVPILRSLDSVVNARSVAAVTGDSMTAAPILPLAIGACRIPSDCFDDSCMPLLSGVAATLPQTGWTALSQSAIRANILDLFPTTPGCGAPCNGENDGSGTIEAGDSISLLTSLDTLLLNCVRRCLVNEGITRVEVPVVTCESFANPPADVVGFATFDIVSVTTSGAGLGITLQGVVPAPGTGGGGAEYFGQGVISLVE